MKEDEKKISYLLVLVGIVLIIIALPGLIVSIKNFHTTNIMIIFIDGVIILGSLVPMSIGLNLIVA